MRTLHVGNAVKKYAEGRLTSAAQLEEEGMYHHRFE